MTSSPLDYICEHRLYFQKRSHSQVPGGEDLNVSVADTFQLTTKTVWWDFPGGPVGENLPCNAEDTDLIRGRRTMIPHAVGQLSPRGATPEPSSHNEDLP